MKVIKYNTLISNCLLFCLILKLKYGSKVKIRQSMGFVKNWCRNRVLCSHYYIEHNTHKWHFTTDEDLKFPKYYALFKGYIKIYD